MSDNDIGDVKQRIRRARLISVLGVAALAAASVLAGTFYSLLRDNRRALLLTTEALSRRTEELTARTEQLEQVGQQLRLALAKQVSGQSSDDGRIKRLLTSADNSKYVVRLSTTSALARRVEEALREEGYSVLLEPPSEGVGCSVAYQLAESENKARQLAASLAQIVDAECRPADVGQLLSGEITARYRVLFPGEDQWTLDVRVYPSK